MADLSTTVSTKGQVILPKPLRESRNWGPGTRLIAEETPDGILLRLAAPPRRHTTVDEVFGSLKYDGPPISVEEMDEAIAEEVRRRWKRGRY